MSKTFTDRTFAIVDVETTGGGPSHDRIIEIAVIRVEKGKIVDSFQALLNPECRVPPTIEMITGINAEELLSKPVFAEVAVRVKELLKGAVFVAHNARFDYGFIKAEFARLEDSYSAKCLCTVRLSRKLDACHKRHDLSTLIDRHGLSCENRHRAYDDAHALFELLHIFHDRNNERFDDAVRALLGGGSLPQHLKEGAIDALPQGPGVYLFYGQDGELLYVGKSIHIRERVLSHFANDSKTTRGMNMYQQVATIETRETSGELGALLLESELIKSLQPLYNRVARRKRKLVLAKITVNEKGYYGITLDIVNSIDPGETPHIAGIFKSRSQAKSALAFLARENKLCEKLVGSESGSGICFGSQIGRCGGACTGRESARSYNKRFLDAVEERRIKIWPFRGSICIEEKSSDGGKEVLIVDNWCLVGSIRFSEEDDRESREFGHDFDYDNYKILARYILDKKNRKNIRLASDGGMRFRMPEYEQVIE